LTAFPGEAFRTSTPTQHADKGGRGVSPSIFLIREEGRLLELTARPYDSEALLQELLAKYPSVLAGDEIDPTSPRRWLLVAREATVPAEEGGRGQWYLDHLFLDQDAIPTLVEVKRRSDSRIRREVVGQMLDYAANGVVYWPLEDLKVAFDETCRKDGRDPSETITAFLGPEANAERFWRNVAENLRSGKVRLVFVADEIPPELRRIVEFLNEQMDPAEVLAVEVQQYVGQGLKTLVPRVVGRTAGSERRKGITAGGQAWGRESFVEALRDSLPSAEAEAIERVLNVCEKIAENMGYGRGRTGSVSPKFQAASTKSFFTIRTNGDLQINQQWHDHQDAGERAGFFRDEFVRLLRAGGLAVPDGPYPRLKASEWTAKSDLLAETTRKLFGSGR
jgi:hypothetical protein